MSARKPPDGSRWIVCDCGRWHLVPLPTPEEEATEREASARRWAVIQEVQALLDDPELHGHVEARRVITALLDIT